MKNIFKVVFVIIGTLIGAGFASGQEMNIFFFSYGLKGLCGILVTSTLMGFVIYKTLTIVSKYSICNYKDFINILIKKESKNKYFNIKNILNIIINIFILITFFIMIAGFGAYFEQEVGINSTICNFVFAFVLYTLFKVSNKSFVNVNNALIPILILFITIVGILNFREINFSEIQNYVIRTNNSNWLISSIVYCSYNSILLIPTLIALKDYYKSKKAITLISIIATIIVIILSLTLFFILARVDVDINNLQMPAVYVITNLFPKLKVIYGIIILASIFTTAMSLGASFLQNVSKDKKGYAQIALIMCITGVLTSQIGFSNLVNLLYPIFGYLGIIQILKIAKTY